MYRAILFDCYGTLIDFPTPRYVSAMEEICRNQGLECDGKQFWEAWLEIGKSIRAIPYPEMSTDGTSKPSSYLIAGPPPPFRLYSEEWGEQFRKTFEAVGLAGDGVRAYADLRRMLSEAPAYPEVHSVIAALNERYVTALMSNADDDFILPCLEHNNLHFDLLVTSEAVRSYKPWPDIFWVTAERLGLPVSDILYVGDSPPSDVLGARSAGMPVAWVNRHETTLPERIPPPDYEIRSLTGLIDILLQPSAGQAAGSAAPAGGWGQQATGGEQ